MAESFYTILTQIGKAKIANAYVLGKKLNIIALAAGDGNGTYYNPTDTQITLKKEVWRGNINSLSVDSQNPNWIIAEAVIPPTDGGFMVREVGIFDDAGDMIAIGKYPETYKPVLADGTAKDLYIRMILEVSNTNPITLKIDPSVIIATKKDITNLDVKIGDINEIEENDIITAIKNDRGALADKASQEELTETKQIEIPYVSKSATKSEMTYQNALTEMASLIPDQTLEQVRNAIFTRGTLRIALVGDSITEGADQTIPEDAYAVRVINAIKQALPNVAIDSFNFALGGRGLSQFNDVNYKGLASDPADKVGGFNRSWSTLGKSWQDHVKDYEPDLLIVAFGMNDSASYQSSANYKTQWDNFNNVIQNFKTVPSIVAVTNMLCSKDANGGKETWFTQTAEITQSVARATREYAKSKKWIIADANRLYNVLVNGIDDCIRYAYKENNWVNFANNWIGDTSSYTVSGVSSEQLNVATNGKKVYRKRRFYNGKFQFYLFTGAGSAYGDFSVQPVYRYSEKAGMFVLKIIPDVSDTKIELHYRKDWSTASIMLGSATVSGKNWNTNFKVVIDVNNTNHKIYIDDVLKIDYTGYEIMSDGYIGFNASSNTNVQLKDLRLTYYDTVGFSKEFDYSDTTYPILSEEQALGATYTGRIQSGNALNHPSGLGHATFYYPVFLPIIKKLVDVSDNGGIPIAQKILSTAISALSASWTQTSLYGEKLFYATFAGGNINPKFVKRLRRLDTGKVYNYRYIADTVTSDKPVNKLKPNEFTYGKSATAGMDILIFSVPEASVTSDFELYRLI